MNKQPTPPNNPSIGEPPKVAPPKRPRRWPWVLAGVILILGAIALYTHRSSPEATRSGRFGGGTNALMISTATAQSGDIGVYVNALGIVTPVYTVSVAARVAGQIMKVNYQEGQDVHAGDSLVAIDPRPYQAAVIQAQGQIEHDTALLEDAKLDLGRYKEAAASKAIPEQQYATQLATVHEDEGSVKLDQGNLDNAKVNLAYCDITSPINGRVGLRLVDPGNIVQANGTTPLAVIVQMQPITVIFDVAENYLSEILPPLHQGKKLTMDVFDRTDQRKIATGTLESLDNEINTATGTLRLRGVCSNEDESLFPNQFVNVRLLVNTLRGVTLLPNTVIQRNSDTAFVYLVKPDNTVEMQPITVGVTDGTVSEIKDLNAGAVVAADNFNRLMDGAKVTVRSVNGESRQESGQSTNSWRRSHSTNSWAPQ